MNDHDLLLTIKAEFGTKLDTLAAGMSALSDGTKTDITQLFNKVDVLEKKDIALEVELKQIAKESGERFYANAQRIKVLEESDKDGVKKSESNKAYYFRLLLERFLIPLFIFLGTLILFKTGIINK